MIRISIAFSILLASFSLAAAQPWNNVENSVVALLEETHVGTIEKTDGKTMTFTISAEKNANKFLTGGKVKGPKGDTMVLTVLDKVKVAKFTFDPTAKKAKSAGIIVGEDVPGGLKNDIFAKGGARVRVKVDDDKKVSEVLIFDDKK
jgi:hypothetical protein